MRIVVKDGLVQSREVAGRNGRDSFTAFFQVAYVESDDERKKFELRVPDRASGYKPGVYQFAAESFTVNAYGGIELARVVLEPLKV